MTNVPVGVTRIFDSTTAPRRCLISADPGRDLASKKFQSGPEEIAVQRQRSLRVASFLRAVAFDVDAGLGYRHVSRLDRRFGWNPGFRPCLARRGLIPLSD